MLYFDQQRSHRLDRYGSVSSTFSLDFRIRSKVALAQTIVRFARGGHSGAGGATRARAPRLSDPLRIHAGAADAGALLGGAAGGAVRRSGRRQHSRRLRQGLPAARQTTLASTGDPTGGGADHGRNGEP